MHTIFQFWVLFSRKIIKLNHPLGRKIIKLESSARSGLSILIAHQDVLILEINEKNVLWTLKKATVGSRMKSSPILGHPPNSFLPMAGNFKFDRNYPDIKDSI